MRAVVTGAAGFIGSHLCSHLLEHGDSVVALDSYTDCYDRTQKERNLAGLRGHTRFTEQRVDCTTSDLRSLFANADVIYHLAAQTGVRASWGPGFPPHSNHNVIATQRVLEAALDLAPWKVVFASCSSVYGSRSTAAHERTSPVPLSPFAVTKLAAEHLVELYRISRGLPTVSLRLFTVFGPRQRPDMVCARLIEAALRGDTFLLYGDGEQTRDLVYVDDVVAALREAGLSPWTGVANIGSGFGTTVNQLIGLVQELVGPVEVIRLPAQLGDVRRTAADLSVARRNLGYRPTVSVRQGMVKMIECARDNAVTDALRGGG